MLFQNMLDGFAYCQMLFDERGRPDDFVYLDVNAAFSKLTGLQDVVGKRVSEVLPGIRESQPELLETYGRVARSGQTERFEVDFRPLGLRLSISVYSPQRDHFVAVFDDITARKRAEQALSEADRRKNEFLAMLSHELRNPLAPVKNSPLDPGARERGRPGAARAGDPQPAGDAPAGLVDDLLDVTRVARSKIISSRQRLELNDVAAHAGRLPHAVLRRMCRSICASSSAPVAVDADRNGSAQVVGNLLHNAAKFTRPGGERRRRLDAVAAGRDA